MILTVKALMTLATALLLVGYRLRKRDSRLHARVMVGGYATFVATAIFLVTSVASGSGGYDAAGWLLALVGKQGAARVILAHRALATVSALLLTTQVVTGSRRMPLHKRLQVAVLVAWMFTYLSGLAIFVGP